MPTASRSSKTLSNTGKIEQHLIINVVDTIYEGNSDFRRKSVYFSSMEFSFIHSLTAKESIFSPPLPPKKNRRIKTIFKV